MIKRLGVLFLTICFYGQVNGAGTIIEEAVNAHRRFLTSILKVPIIYGNQEINTGIYRHYKGNFYELLGACKHTETKEELVYYRALYGDYQVWVRPLTMFFETVEVEGEKLPRFAFVVKLHA